MIDPVQVAQCDREAAAQWKGIWGSFAKRLPEGDLAYAFARHRQSAERRAGEAIPAGMKPWSGDDSAPEDWDGENEGLLFRDGKRYGVNDDGWFPYLTDDDQWSHTGDPKDIIAYTPKPTPTAKNGAQPDEVRARAQELLAVACEACELEDYAAHVRGMVSPGSQWPWIAPAILAIETAATEARASDGWVLVPREPSEAMVKAWGMTTLLSVYTEAEVETMSAEEAEKLACELDWSAMIAAVEYAR